MLLLAEGESLVRIEGALAVLERDGHRHMTVDPAGEHELGLLEQNLGRRLPVAFRTLLARLGGGILYERHEVHLLDLRARGRSAVVSLDGTRSYPDLARFLEEVVLPIGANAGS